MHEDQSIESPSGSIAGAPNFQEDPNLQQTVNSSAAANCQEQPPEQMTTQGVRVFYHMADN
jgi:hypothetical protein